MLFVTPFHPQFGYVYFQKQNGNPFKILSLQSTACASAAFWEKETAFMDKSLPFKTMSEQSVCGSAADSRVTVTQPLSVCG